MSKIDVRVHALPTNKASHIKFIPKGEYEEIGGKLVKTTIDKYLYVEKATEFGYPSTFLYVTTSETPKEGDWCVGNDFGENVHKCVVESNCKAIKCRKVVATDDKSLLKNDCDCGATTYEGCSQCLTGIGKLSPEFQAAWVREMNIGTPIVEALMEMEEFYSFGIDDILTVNKNVYGFSKGSKITVTEVKGDIIYFKEDNVHKKGFHVSHLEHSTSLQPKLNPQGYVTILPVKEKMYTKEEIINIVKKFNHHTLKLQEYHLGNSFDVNDWVSENL